LTFVPNIECRGIEEAHAKEAPWSGRGVGQTVRADVAGLGANIVRAKTK
jgi:hypothetical protein